MPSSTTAVPMTSQIVNGSPSATAAMSAANTGCKLAKIAVRDVPRRLMPKFQIVLAPAIETQPEKNTPRITSGVIDDQLNRRKSGTASRDVKTMPQTSIQKLATRIELRCKGIRKLSVDATHTQDAITDRKSTSSALSPNP